METVTLKLQTGDKRPLYEQIYRYFIGEMEAGRLKEGEKLPSKRALRAALGVSQSTVETAYGMLTAEGYLRAVSKSGYYVSAALARAMPAGELRQTDEGEDRPPRPPRFDFSTGAVDTSLFPYASWARISREVISRDPQLLQRGEAGGDRSFRETLTVFLREYRGVRCEADQIVVGAGIEYLLSVVVRLLPADAVYAVENPGYSALHRVLRSHDRSIRPIPLDGEGMEEDALRRSGADVACVTPSHQFPMGVTMPAGRRSRLLRWAEEQEGRYLIEDDYDSEFRYASRPIPAMQSMDSEGKVIYVGTFSRSVAPGIRVAYLVLPRPLLGCYRQVFGYGASTVSRFEQQTLRLFIQRGLYSRHLRRSVNLYRKKQELLLSGLRALPGAETRGTEAGLHFLLTLPGRDEAWLTARAARADIPLRGLSAYCLGAPPIAGTVVVGFAGLRIEEIPDAARTLVEAFAE